MKFFRWAWLGIFVLIAAEQGLLSFYLDGLVLHQDAEFQKFIEETKNDSGSLRYLQSPACKYQWLGMWPYKYQMCIYDSSMGLSDVQEPIHFLIVQHIDPILSLYTPSSPGHILGGTYVFAIDNAGKVIRDFRKDATTGEGDQPAAEAKPAADPAEPPKPDAHGG